MYEIRRICYYNEYLNFIDKEVQKTISFPSTSITVDLLFSDTGPTIRVEDVILHLSNFNTKTQQRVKTKFAFGYENIEDDLLRSYFWLGVKTE